MIKVTNKMALEFALSLEEVVANEEVYNKLAKMLEQVEKKNSSVDKDGKKVLSATQKQNENLKKEILGALANQEEPVQIKDLVVMECFAERGLTNQKLSSLVRQLVAENKVERIEEKKVAKFKIV